MNLPRMEVIQLDNAVNPSGFRNLHTSGFLKVVDTSSSGVLDFGYLENTTSGTFAGTRLIFARPATMGDATVLRNFRLYLSSITAWGTGLYRFLWRPQIGFTSGIQLSLPDLNIPTSLPGSGNLLSTHNDNFIQTIAESGCTEYAYLDVYADIDVQAKQYGGPGANSFRYRLTYDFY